MYKGVLNRVGRRSVGSGVSIQVPLGSSVEGKGVSMSGCCVTGVTGVEGAGGRTVILEKGSIVGRGDLKLGNSGDQRRYALLRGR